MKGDSNEFSMRSLKDALNGKDRMTRATRGNRTCGRLVDRWFLINSYCSLLFIIDLTLRDERMFRLMGRLVELRRSCEQISWSNWKPFVTIRWKCFESRLNDRSIHRQTEEDPMSATIYFDIPF